jgi:hypothetical protein
MRLRVYLSALARKAPNPLLTLTRPLKLVFTNILRSQNDFGRNEQGTQNYI